MYQELQDILKEVMVIMSEAVLLIDKAVKVIASCKTIEQCASATVFVKLVCRRYAKCPSNNMFREIEQHFNAMDLEKELLELLKDKSGKV